jgi:hypothetical protein
MGWKMTVAAGALFVAAGQSIGSSTHAQTPVVTYNKDVLPVLQKNCQSCHRPGQIGPFSMLTYKETRPWAKAMKAAVVSRKMPPWFADPQYGHFENDRSLSQADIATIVAWTDGGAVEGSPSDAPAPIEWLADGWQIKPDVIVEMPPFDVPAKGVLDWMTIAFPAPFKEDTWVTSAELVPSAASVVHHMCYGFQDHLPTTMYNTYEWTELPRDENGIEIRVPAGNPPPERTVATREAGSREVKRRTGRPVLRDINQFCFLPGLQYEDFRDVNAGFFVPAGSDLTVNVHYTTSGLAITDRAKIGFTVAKTRPAKRLVSQAGESDAVGQSPNTRNIAIPPFEGDYRGPLQVINIPRDIELVRLRPHAHVRGKSVQYKLFYPDGREEILLNVPRYDFNWQLTYKTSKLIPKGSRVEVQFHYDNSTANKYNPDPANWVYYGLQSWEEMGAPFLGFLIPSSENDRDYLR